MKSKVIPLVSEDGNKDHVMVGFSAEFVKACSAYLMDTCKATHRGPEPGPSVGGKRGLNPNV